MVFLAIAVALLSLAVAAAICSSLLAHPPAGLIRTNFRGSQVAVVGGIVILAGLLAGEVGLSIAYLLHPGGGAAPTFTSRDHWGLLVAALGFFGLGLLDDVAGNARSRGFRGHARALARGEVTTGAKFLTQGHGAGLFEVFAIELVDEVLGGLHERSCCLHCSMRGNGSVEM